MKHQATQPKTQPAVCVVGLGYVGLTLALTLSEMGLRVFGVDTDKHVVDGIHSNSIHFYEKGLSDLLTQQRERGFSCSTSLPRNDKIYAYIIAVGTPVGDDNAPRFDELTSSCQEVGSHLKPGSLVVLRSTVPVGISRNLVIPLLEKTSGLTVGKDFFVSFAPERTIEGDALRELKFLPQIIGGYDKESIDRTSSLFGRFAASIVVTDSLEEAEMIKMTNNAYRDLIFGFANELALICDKLNINVHKLINAANLGYERSNIPKASPGVGGYCLTKDPYLLAYSAAQLGHEARLPAAGRLANTSMPLYIYQQIQRFTKRHLSDIPNVRVTLFGFAFKGEPPTSDMRFSPTLDVLRYLQGNRGYTVYGHDPLVPVDTIASYGVSTVENIEAAFTDAHIVVFMNRHKIYREIPLPALVGRMASPALCIDPWGMFDERLLNGVPERYYATLGYSSHTR